MKNTYELKDGALSLKTIGSDDIELLRVWRNQDGVGKGFLNADKITAEQQTAWFSRYLADEKDYIFLVSLDGRPCGMSAIYHIDDDAKTCEFGRLLIGEGFARGKGLGCEITRILCNFALDRLGMEKIVLEVFSDNLPAYKTYVKAGFMSTASRVQGGREVYIMCLRKQNQI